MTIENPYLKFINEDGSIKKEIIADPDELRPVLKKILGLPGIKKVTSDLEKRSQAILDLYNKGYSQKQIAETIGISRERVRQLLPPGIAKDRAQQKKEFIEYYKTVKQVIRVLRQFAIWNQHNLNGYRNGCKCEICMAANNAVANKRYHKNIEHRRAKANEWRRANPDKHLKYVKRWKKKAIKEMKAGLRPHNATGYLLKCRCAICTAANTESARKEREKARIKSLNLLVQEE